MADSTKTIPTLEEIKNLPSVKEVMDNAEKWWEKATDEYEAAKKYVEGRLAKPEQPASVKETPLTEDEKIKYNELIAAAKNRRAEDETLVKQVGTTISAVTGLPLGGIGSVIGGSAGYLTGGHFMDNDYKDKKLYERGNLSERKHYELLQKSAENRQAEDEELGCLIGEKIGGNIASKVGASAFCKIGEMAVSAKYNHADTFDDAIEQIKKEYAKAVDSSPELAEKIIKFEKNMNIKVEDSFKKGGLYDAVQCWANESLHLEPPCPPKTQNGQGR